MPVFFYRWRKAAEVVFVSTMSRYSADTVLHTACQYCSVSASLCHLIYWVNAAASPDLPDHFPPLHITSTNYVSSSRCTRIGRVANSDYTQQSVLEEITAYHQEINKYVNNSKKNQGGFYYAILITFLLTYIHTNDIKSLTVMWIISYL